MPSKGPARRRRSSSSVFRVAPDFKFRRTRCRILIDSLDSLRLSGMGLQSRSEWISLRSDSPPAAAARSSGPRPGFESVLVRGPLARRPGPGPGALACAIEDTTRNRQEFKLMVAGLASCQCYHDELRWQLEVQDSISGQETASASCSCCQLHGVK